MFKFDKKDWKKVSKLNMKTFCLFIERAVQPSLNPSVAEEGDSVKADTSLSLIESETNKMVNGFDKFFSEGLPEVALPKQFDHRDIFEKDNAEVPSPMLQESVDQEAEPGGEFNSENWLTKVNQTIEEKKNKKKKKKKNRENRHQER